MQRTFWLDAYVVFLYIKHTKIFTYREHSFPSRTRILPRTSPWKRLPPTTLKLPYSQIALYIIALNDVLRQNKRSDAIEVDRIRPASRFIPTPGDEARACGPCAVSFNQDQIPGVIFGNVQFLQITNWNEMSPTQMALMIELKTGLQIFTSLTSHSLSKLYILQHILEFTIIISREQNTIFHR